MNDERQGLPSASIMPRLAACPASWLRSKNQEDIPDVSSEDATFGTHVARILECNVTEDQLGFEPSDQEEDTANECELWANELVQKHLPDHTEVHAEKRLWIKEGAKPVCSARYDRLYIRLDPLEALLVEFKSLYGDIAAAPLNYQLRTQAIAVAQAYLNPPRPGGRSLRAAIVQPKVFPRTSVCYYTYDDLCEAANELFGILRLANSENAPVAPGSQCTFCPAKTTCEEFRQYITPSLPAKLQELPVETWSRERRALFLDRKGLAIKWIEATTEACWQLLNQDPKAIPGYMLKDWPPLTPIVNPNLVAGRLNALGCSEPEIVKCCQMVKERLTKLVKLKTELKGKALEAMVEEMIAGATEEHPQRKRLVKVKELPPNVRDQAPAPSQAPNEERKP